MTSPLIGSLHHEDLALELMAPLSKGDACLRRELPGTDLLLLAVTSEAGRVARQLFAI